MSNMNFRKSRLTIFAGFVLLFALILSACSGGDSGPELTPLPTERPDRPEEELSELPTAIVAEDVGDEALSGAKGTPQETWNNYLRDIIAEQVSDRQQKLQILQRYENPDITQQNTGGLVTDIDLVEDRTIFSTTTISASSIADFDVRLSFLNGDSDTRTCAVSVIIEFDEEAGLWYVLNPAPLQVFGDCPG